MSLITAWFALPSVGGAVVRSRNRPSRTSRISFLLARGCTRTDKTRSSPSRRIHSAGAGSGVNLDQAHQQSHQSAEADQCEDW